MARRKSKSKKTEKALFASQPLLITVIVAFVLIVSVGFIALSAQAGQQAAGEKVARFTTPLETVKTAEVKQPDAVAAEKLPDLQVQMFSSYSGETKQSVRITTDAMNKGDADVTTSYIITYSYDKPIGTNRVDSVVVGTVDVKAPHKAGATKPLVFLWITETAGTYNLKACADVDSKIKESNKNNNCATTAVTVKDFAKYG